MTSSLTPTNPADFEKHIAFLFRQVGFGIVMPKQNTKGYDIEIEREGKCIAVQCKNQKAKCSVTQIKKFQEFLDQPLADKFNEGYFISANGYSQPALTHVYAESPKNLRLGTYRDDGTIEWEYPISNPPIIDPLPITDLPTKHIGVFTSKGGVGKTTVAAHLAGAFALMGHDVILIDLDPDKNLRKLFLNPDGHASLFVEPPKKNKTAAKITVLTPDEWDESRYPQIRIVIYDCSPVLSENDPSFVEKFDYCIIPTTLNPLGIAKNADVLIRTFKHVRELNSKAEMFALINSLNDTSANNSKNEKLLTHLKKHLNNYIEQDQKCKLIDPDNAKIRYSNALFYWGYHIIDNSKPHLAFQEMGGRCHPREDFLELANYLEDHTDIDQLRD